MNTLKFNRKKLRYILFCGLATASAVPPAAAATLWSVPESYLGTGYFFGPGAYMIPTPLFPVMIRNMAFTTDHNFLTPFWNNGGQEPNLKGEKDFPPVDGKLSNGALINENADLGVFTLAGARFLPAVVEGGEYVGEQRATTDPDGNVVMEMELMLDMGIGEKGVIRIPFRGTTGTVAVPAPLANEQGSASAESAGPLKTGETLSGRIGDFNGDGFIDGTLVAVGVMPLSSPVYPGQPFAMSRNFETDIPIEGAIFGSPKATNKAYGLPPAAGAEDGSKR